MRRAKTSNGIAGYAVYYLRNAGFVVIRERDRIYINLDEFCEYSAVDTQCRVNINRIIQRVCDDHSEIGKVHFEQVSANTWVATLTKKI
jgi:hypothetical protein